MRQGEQKLHNGMLLQYRWNKNKLFEFLIRRTVGTIYANGSFKKNKDGNLYGVYRSGCGSSNLAVVPYDMQQTRDQITDNIIEYIQKIVMV